MSLRTLSTNTSVRFCLDNQSSRGLTTELISFMDRWRKKQWDTRRISKNQVSRLPRVREDVQCSTLGRLTRSGLKKIIWSRGAAVSSLLERQTLARHCELLRRMKWLLTNWIWVPHIIFFGQSQEPDCRNSDCTNYSEYSYDADYEVGVLDSSADELASESWEDTPASYPGSQDRRQ